MLFIHMSLTYRLSIAHTSAHFRRIHRWRYDVRPTASMLRTALGRAYFTFTCDRLYRNEFQLSCVARVSRSRSAAVMQHFDRDIQLHSHTVLSLSRSRGLYRLGAGRLSDLSLADGMAWQPQHVAGDRREWHASRGLCQHRCVAHYRHGGGRWSDLALGARFA